MHQTQIRITNTSKQKQTIALKDIIAGKKLKEQGILYNYQGEHEYVNTEIKVKHITFASHNIFNTIHEIIHPKIKIDHYKSRVTDKFVKVILEEPINIEELVFVLNPINHVVITIFQPERKIIHQD